MFAQDRDGRLSKHMVFLRAQTLEHEGDDDVEAALAAQNEAAFRSALVDNLVNVDDNDVAEIDRALFLPS